MKQTCTIIWSDEDGKRSRIVFRQGGEMEDVNMIVKEMDPAEAVKLLMLVKGLADQAVQQIATMANDSRSVN